MPSDDVVIPQNWQKQFLFVIALFLIALFAVLSIFALRKFYAWPVDTLVNLALYCFFGFIPIHLGWLSFRKIGALIFLVLAAGLATLQFAATGEPELILFPICYVIFFFLLSWAEKKRTDEIVIREVEIEKQLAEKNDLELTFVEKGKNISVCFEKYSAYYNLRRLADEFSTTFELAELGNLIVSRTLEFVQRGDWCLLFLGAIEQDGISLIASKHARSTQKAKKKLGDVFDFWVLRNRQHLFVSDTQKDFRFDLKKTALLEDLRSAILAPITHENKVIGTLRINSELPGTFTTDHLRFLDAIATLASSALSNAVLYQKTEELAIRDSLTHLYVQRYFMERLREEHKRALITHGKLAMLMCDLDYFKRINDQFGHTVGDLVLSRVADVLRELCENGIVARYGGEEFTVLLPQTSKKEAIHIAEKICERLGKEKIEVRRQNIQVTVSIGAAAIPEDTLDAEELVRKADERMYQAKTAGRNQVC